MLNQSDHPLWPWFRQYAQCQVADTRRLGWSLAEHGAVEILRRWCWLAPETSIRRADVERILRIGKRELQRVIPAILQHFTVELVEGQEWLVDTELREQKGYVSEVSEKRRAAANARHSQSKRDANAPASAVLGEERREYPPLPPQGGDVAAPSQPRTRRRRPAPAPSHVPNMPLGSSACACAACVAVRAKAACERAAAAAESDAQPIAAQSVIGDVLQAAAAGRSAC